MKEPFWKRILSYFYEVPLASGQSDINGKVSVNLYQDRYLLCTDNAIYSFDDKYTNFSYALNKIRWKQFQLDNVLLLGYGLGSVLYILEKEGKKVSHATGVEVDEVVKKFAERYSLPRLSTDIDLVKADAEEYVNDCDQNFSLIAIDIFINDIIPGQFKKKGFLKSVKSILQADGILMFNFLAENKRDIAMAKTYFYKIFAPEFDNAGILEAGRNYILTNEKEQFREDVHWIK